MRVLIWQWGRRGAGPRFAAALKAGFQRLPGTEAVLSLSSRAELLQGPDAPACEWPVGTYAGIAEFAMQWIRAPARISTLAAHIRSLRPDIAICGMAGPLDLLMATALHRAGVRFAVVVHDADSHPGDGFPLQMMLQRELSRRADALVSLTSHVAERLTTQGLVRERDGRKRLLVRSRLPPFVFGPMPPPPRAHGGRLRLLSFGRLLPYKGLDLLAEALAALGPSAEIEVRVVGSGPESADLTELRRLGVTVENRWVPEGELAELIAWADVMVLPYREASQSGAAAAAIAAGRWILATRVGGMQEQLGGEAHVHFADPNAESVTQTIRALLATPAAGASPGIDVPADWQAMAADLADALAPLTVRAPVA
jgi:glycosyltransferase involved in cell wall biosynthesis